MCTRIYFLRGKLQDRQFQQHARIDSKRLITNIVNRFSNFSPFRQHFRGLFVKIPPVGSQRIEDTALEDGNIHSTTEPPGDIQRLTFKYID